MAAAFIGLLIVAITGCPDSTAPDSGGLDFLGDGGVNVDGSGIIDGSPGDIIGSGEVNDGADGSDGGEANNEGDAAPSLGEAVFNAGSALVFAHRTTKDDVVIAITNPDQRNGDDIPLAVNFQRTLMIRALAVNSRGHLLLLVNGTIEIYATPESIATNTPSRVVTGEAPGHAIDFVLDRARDELYVKSGNQITVYKGTTGDDFNGAVVPSRTINSTVFDTANGFGRMALSAKDELFLLFRDFDNNKKADDETLVVLSNASKLDGPARVARTFSFPQFTEGFGILGDFTIDASDNFIMFATRQYGDTGFRHGIINVPMASTLQGEIFDPPFIGEEVPVRTPSSGIAIDIAGSVYFGVPEGISVYHNVVGRDGLAAPDRTIASSFTDTALLDDVREIVEPNPMVIVD